jgi:predicted nucleic acid-binding Zn ribbon protein
VSMREKPTPLGEALQKYLQESGLEERLEEAGVVPEWAERVGPAIAAVTMPLRTSAGALVVAVKSSAWLSELKLMEREILRRLNEGRSKGRIRAIRFVMADGGDVPGARP